MKIIRRKAQKPQTVTDLNRSFSRSYVSRVRVRFYALVGRLKRFYHEYRLPSVATTVFLAIVLGLGIIRQLEKTSLIALRNDVTGGGNGYSLLLSSEGLQQFTRDNTTEQSNQQSQQDGSSNSDSTQSTSNSFSLTSDSPTPVDNGSGSTGGGGTGSGGGSSGGGNSGTGGGGNEPPAVPFSASIDDFNQGNISLLCNNPSNPKKGTCSKVYSFRTRVQTANGPGTVNYSWQSDISAGNGSGNFSVGSGETITSVSKEITLACNKNSNFNIQFAIISPSISNSNTISVNHNCDEL